MPHYNTYSFPMYIAIHKDFTNAIFAKNSVSPYIPLNFSFTSPVGRFFNTYIHRLISIDFFSF